MRHAIFTQKYSIFMTCSLPLDARYSINYLFGLQKKVESISINHKNDQGLFLRFINAICFLASVASAILLLFSGSVIMTLCIHGVC